MIRSVVIFVLFCIFAGSVPVRANDLTVDLAQDFVDITTGFNGAHLILYGVKGAGQDVAVVVRGPKGDVLVRQKQKIAGAWLNRDSLKFEEIPQFYDYALSADQKEMLDDKILQEIGVGFEALKFKPVDDKVSDENKKIFQEALLRNKQSIDLFPTHAKDVVFLSSTFFKTQLYVPPNVPTGNYSIETFLIGNGKIVDKNVTSVRVAQVGFSAGIYQFAHEHALAYAVCIVVIAAFAGWLSNAVRRKQ